MLSLKGFILSWPLWITFSWFVLFALEVATIRGASLSLIVTQFLMRFIYVATDQNREHLVTQGFSGSVLFPKLLRESQQAFAKNGLRKLVFMR